MGYHLTCSFNVATYKIILNICYSDFDNTVKLGYNGDPAITNNMSSLGLL